MVAFIISQGEIVKEAFSYERPLSEASLQAVLEYAQANYGANAIVRQMTSTEEANFERYGAEFFKQHSEL
jgi:hypothetical protein